MTSKKQLFFNIGFVLLVFFFTLNRLSKETNLEGGIQKALNLNMFYLLVGFCLILAYVLIESVILYFLLNKIDKGQSFPVCALYSFIGFLYSCITPSASGGQPAQMYYMKKDGIMVGESTPMLMIVTIAYKGVLVLVGAMIIFFNISDITAYISGAGIYIYIGLAANVVLLIFMVLLLIKPQLLYVFCRAGYNGILARLLGKYRFKARDKAVKYLDKYITTAIYYKGHYSNMAWPVLGLTVLQRMAYFGVTVAVYKAFNLSNVSLLTVLILAASINVAVDMLPLPGGMGATELLFISLFSEIFGRNKVVTALLVNRFLTFYILIILGIIAVVVANIRINRKKKLKGI